MNNIIDRSINELREMDDLASRSSFIHKISPGVKLLTTITYIAIVASFHKYNLTGLLFMIFYPVILFAISGIPVSLCFRKLAVVLPLVCLVGLFNPFFDRTPMAFLGPVTVTGGMISMASLMLKGLFCLMASFLLIATTPIEAICQVLRKIHIPSFLVTLLLLTCRYISLMAEEVSIMTRAYSLRAPGQKGIHYSAWGSFLGQLLLRSMDRAEELYSAMLLRGYHGEFYYAKSSPLFFGDVAYAGLWIVFFVLARAVNLTLLIGSI